MKFLALTGAQTRPCDHFIVIRASDATIHVDTRHFVRIARIGPTPNTPTASKWSVETAYGFSRHEIAALESLSDETCERLFAACTRHNSSIDERTIEATEC
jgi:hypothetical protein